MISLARELVNDPQNVQHVGDRDFLLHFAKRDEWALGGHDDTSCGRGEWKEHLPCSVPRAL